MNGLLHSPLFIIPFGIRREYPHLAQKKEITKVDKIAGGVPEKGPKILKQRPEKALEKESWKGLVEDAMTRIGL
jgi:hypothetical protein